jgi:hypothetical protein
MAASAPQSAAGSHRFTSASGAHDGSGSKAVPLPTTTAIRSGASPTTTPAAQGGACPDPRYCADFTLLGGRWPTDANGDFFVHYRVNVTSPPPRTDLTTSQIVQAIDAAAHAWMAADPHVHLVYDGLTTEAPDPRSCNNVIAFAVPGVGEGTPCADQQNVHYSGFVASLPNTFTWRPCGAGGDPCDPYDGGNYGIDLQQVATHEWGHVLGLDHPNGGKDLKDEQLSMWGSVTNSQCGGGCRWMVTLGLGDILGLRQLYPTSAAMPGILSP